MGQSIGAVRTGVLPTERLYIVRLAEANLIVKSLELFKRILPRRKGHVLWSKKSIRNVGAAI